jgi:hypothetical protein
MRSEAGYLMLITENPVQGVISAVADFVHFKPGEGPRSKSIGFKTKMCKIEQRKT